MIHILYEHFGHPLVALLFPILLPAVLFGWHKRQVTILHPSLTPQLKLRRRISMMHIVCYAALTVLLASSTMSLMEPRQPAAVVQHIEQKRNVCFFVDRSGSMLSILNDGEPDLADASANANNDPNAKVVNNGGSDKSVVSAGNTQAALDDQLVPGVATRVDGAYATVRYMINHRMTDNPDETDRFCLMTFDTDSYMMAPLSTDKKVLMLRTVHLEENVGGGTNFFGPTSSETGVGPLQKAVDYFTKATDKGSVNIAILVTDGYDSGDPARMQQLLSMYQAAHVRLYVIGIGDAWDGTDSLDLQTFANDLHALDKTNGIVFRAQNPGQLKAAMQTINSLEKSQEVIDAEQTYQDTPFWFLVAAFGSCFVLVISSSLMRRIP